MKKIILLPIFSLIFGLFIFAGKAQALDAAACTFPSNTSNTDYGYICDVQSGGQRQSSDLITTVQGSADLNTGALGLCQHYQDDTEYYRGTRTCDNTDIRIDFVSKGPRGQICIWQQKFCGGSNDTYSGNGCSGLNLNPPQIADRNNPNYWDARECAQCQGASATWNPASGVAVNSLAAVNYRTKLIEYNRSNPENFDDTRVDVEQSILDFMFVVKKNGVAIATKYLMKGSNAADYNNYVACSYKSNADSWKTPTKRDALNHRVECNLTKAYPVIAGAYAFEPGASYKLETYVKPRFAVGSNDWISYRWDTATQKVNADICNSTYNVPTPTPAPLVNCESKQALRANGVLLGANDKVRRGDSVIYRITYKNPGVTTLASGSFTDDLPVGFSVVTAPAGCGAADVAGGAQRISCPIANLAGGVSATVDIVVKVGADVAAGDYTNTVRVSPAGSTPTCTSKVGVEVPIPSVSCSNKKAYRANGVEIVSSTGSIVSRGETISYTINYANNSDADATGVIVVDTLPVGMSFVSGTDCSASGQTVTCQVGGLAKRQLGSRSFDARVSTSVGSNIVLTDNAETQPRQVGSPSVVCTHTVSSQTTTTNTPTPTTPTPSQSKVDCSEKKAYRANGVEIVSSTSSIVSRGETVRYTISYTNNSDASATGVSVVDTLPVGMSFVSGTGCTVSGQTVTCIVGNVGARQSGTWSFDARVSTSVGSGVTLTDSAEVLPRPTSGPTKVCSHTVRTQTTTTTTTPTPTPTPTPTVAKCEIGGKKFEDGGANGRPDRIFGDGDSYSNVTNWRFYLYRVVNGVRTQIATTTTVDNTWSNWPNSFKFGNLDCGGTYVIKEELKSGWISSGDYREGIRDHADGVTDGSEVQFVLTSGMAGYHFGNKKSSSGAVVTSTPTRTPTPTATAAPVNVAPAPIIKAQTKLSLTQRLTYNIGAQTARTAPIYAAPSNSRFPSETPSYFVANLGTRDIALRYFMDCTTANGCNDVFDQAGNKPAQITLKAGYQTELGLGAACSNWKLNLAWKPATANWNWDLTKSILAAQTWRPLAVPKGLRIDCR